MSETRKTFVGPWIVLGLLIGVAVVGGIVSLLVRFSLVPPSFRWNRAWYEGIAQQVQSGALVPNAGGVVKLGPSGLHGTFGARVDEVLVTGSPTSGWVIFFPHWRGKGMNIEGYLYAKPAIAGSTVTLPGWPGPLGPPGSSGATPATASVNIEQSLAPSWYLAAWRED